MSKLAIFLKYFAMVLNAVIAVEGAIQAPGQQKQAVAAGMIDPPEDHAAGVLALIDHTVGVLNKTRIFTTTA